MKAHYFPRHSFFTAEIGDRPSLTWNSIWTAELLYYQDFVGDWQRIESAIWGDSWLSIPSIGKIITHRPPYSNFQNLVSDLIDWNAWSWNFGLKSSIFWPVDVDNILQVPIGSPKAQDLSRDPSSLVLKIHIPNFVTWLRWLK